MFACSQDKYPRGVITFVDFYERKFGEYGEPVPYGHRIHSNETNGREEQSDIPYDILYIYIADYREDYESLDLSARRR